MSGTRTPRPPSRGRIDKRQAILDAAFTVFAQRGYARACMEEIAEVAGVAKHTVYNHLADKQNVFRSAMEAAADDVMTKNLAVVAELSIDSGTHGASPTAAADLSAPLEDMAHRLLLRCCDAQSRALRRLLHAEITQFPELLEVAWARRECRLREALADRLARLALSGRLRHCDPAEAAEQFLALLTGPLEVRSHFGTRDVPEAEVRQVGRSAVRTFLRAYGASVPAP
ncbi:TetR/AcrR family transcriptional regulator [Streptomyces sp. NPDC058221]|uniref:TetR/AcrR family transcriptional regulator n=1 Tax=Streptomyces sp. NPDC058221 TaxID=3346388 RepID=UPI0036E9D1AB